MEKLFLLDLDGTMYRGTKIQTGAKELMEELHRLQLPYLFLTNNSMRTRRQNVEHMENMGFTNIQESDFFTSAMAASIYAAKHYTSRKAFYIGQDGLREALVEQGFEIIQEEQPDFVFVGLDAHGDYATYSKALNYLMNGAILIGTNHDRMLAQPNGFSVGNGAIVSMMEYASSQHSPRIGKPNEPILSEALRYCGKSKEEVILIGDNLETDIALGVNYNVESILVLGGVHGIEDCDQFDIHPTHVCADLHEVLSKFVHKL